MKEAGQKRPHKTYGIINIYCFRPLNLGEICYIAMDNKSSGFVRISVNEGMYVKCLTHRRPP